MRTLVCAMTLSFVASAAYADAPQAALDLIASADAQGVFEAAPSEPGAIIVTHPRSGLVCRLGAGAANRLLIFPQAARGEDVACETSADGETVVLFATRFSFTTSLDEQINGVADAIRRRYPEAQPAPAVRPIISDTLPPHRSSAFYISREGARCLTSVSVAQVGDWIIKLRYTAPAPNEAAARAAEQNAERRFNEALQAVVTRAD